MTAPPVALVTGGTKGIGRACVEELAARGFTVVLTGRTQHAVEQAAEGVRAAGATAIGAAADVASSADTRDLLARIERDVGRLDTLVINSGGPPKGDFSTLDDADWTIGIDEVLVGAIRHIRGALHLLQASPRGRIVIIGSSSVRRPIERLTISNVLRPALGGLVSTLAVELGPAGVTVNMVAPGRTDTARLEATDRATAERQGRTFEAVREDAASRIPMGRIAEPSEIAATVAFLASEEAAYLTGQCLLVDGALTLGTPWH